MGEPRLLVEARNGAFAVEQGRVAQLGGRHDVVLHVPDWDLRPGLINAHDHLHRNHFGRLGDPPYADAYAWAADVQSRFAGEIAEGRRKPRREALLAGAWKNLFAGVTTVVHHDRWESDFEADFPLRVHSIRNWDALGMPRPAELPAANEPFCVHLAEGTHLQSADEVRTLEALGLLGRALIAVHGVGMDEDAIRRFRASGAALVWCPTSNLFLFGRTAPAALLREGIDVLLGSDSLLSGAGDLLDELRCARRLCALDDDRLEDAVGRVAARRLNLPPPSLDPGAAADLFLCAKPLLEASAEDVKLVMVDGYVRVADPTLVPGLGPPARHGRIMTVGGVTRWTFSDEPRRSAPPALSNSVERETCT